MNSGRARPQLARRGEGAPKTRDKMDGSAIRCHVLLLALLLASCAAPDTRHQIVVSTRNKNSPLLIAATSRNLSSLYLKFIRRLGGSRFYAAGNCRSQKAKSANNLKRDEWHGVPDVSRTGNSIAAPNSSTRIGLGMRSLFCCN